MHTSQIEKTVPKLVVKRVIKASRERVFEAWTNPKLLEEWLHPKGWSAKSSVDLRKGGHYSHNMISDGSGNSCSNGEEIGKEKGESFPHTGEYLEIVAPERLVFTWNSRAAQNTRVTVELRDLGGSTELTLTHEFFETEEVRNMHNEGWDNCLVSLAERFGG